MEEEKLQLGHHFSIAFVPNVFIHCSQYLEISALPWGVVAQQAVFISVEVYWN